jgi:metal-responsive CopG/Arc/MetJ family transcriptional regulator
MHALNKGGAVMKMERVMVQLPATLKAKLDALRAKGYTASGYIRALLERDLNAAAPATGRKGR